MNFVEIKAPLGLHFKLFKNKKKKKEDAFKEEIEKK